jgi:hypothetical protein
MDELNERCAGVAPRAASSVAAHARAVGAVIWLAVMPALGLAGGPADVAVSRAWVRATAPGQPVAAAYMDVTSARGGTLAHVAADVAGAVQMHSMRMDGEVMRMRELAQLVLPKGQTVQLAPSGNHLMLLQLKRPLRPGDIVRFDLTVIDASGHRQVVRAVATVRQSVDLETR